MVVLPPFLLNNGRLTYSYQFYPAASSKNWTPIASIKKSLDSISGKCQMCSKNANVAFYDKDNIQWLGELAKVGSIESISPQLVCNVCAMNLIMPYLKKYAGDFDMGLSTPFGGDGCYMLRDW